MAELLAANWSTFPFAQGSQRSVQNARPVIQFH
jgi:hypothetical protein